MKKRLLMILSALLLVFCCACGTAATEEAAPTAAPSASSPTPTPTPVPPERTLNQELTDLIAENFTYNFDEADWYPYIDHLAVYDSDEEGRYLEIVFDLSEGTAAKKHIKNVVNAMYGNYCYAKPYRDYGIQKTVGVDLNGTIWHSRDHLG